MPLTLPQLDDRSWDDLTEEGCLLIPTLTREWTNFNPSDPGITLLELLAYFCESFCYRLNRVSESNIHSFLKLINGPEWHPKSRLEDEIRQTIVNLERPERAVTARDYEWFALSLNHRLGPKAPVRVARARCWPRHNLRKSASAAGENEVYPYVSLVVLPDPPDADTADLFKRLHELIDCVRTITTRVQIVAPHYLNVGVRVSIESEPHAAPEELRPLVMDTLKTLFSPLHGGRDGQGWPFGRSVYVSEVYELLLNIPGVRRVHQIRLAASEKYQDELLVDPSHANRLQYNRLGELEAVELYKDELVQCTLNPSDIIIESGWRMPGE